MICRAFPTSPDVLIDAVSFLATFTCITQPGNKYRTMARTIKCQFDFSSPNFQLVSPNAIDFIRKV